MKSFLTYEQQLIKLVDEKHLLMNDREFAEEKLRDNGGRTVGADVIGFPENW